MVGGGWVGWLGGTRWGHTRTHTHKHVSWFVGAGHWGLGLGVGLGRRGLIGIQDTFRVLAD